MQLNADAISKILMSQCMRFPTMWHFDMFRLRWASAASLDTPNVVQSDCAYAHWLILGFAGRTYHIVGNLMHWLNFIVWFCVCPGDNLLAKARGLSSHTDVQTIQTYTCTKIIVDSTRASSQQNISNIHFKYSKVINMYMYCFYWW